MDNSPKAANLQALRASADSTSSAIRQQSNVPVPGSEKCRQEALTVAKPVAIKADTNITAQSRPDSSTSKPWAPWQLHKRGLSALLTFELVTFTTMGTLLAVSFTQSGFATVPDPPSFLAGNPDLVKALWSSGFLWTFLPTLYMTVYGMLWDSVVTALAEQQPWMSMAATSAPYELNMQRLRRLRNERALGIQLDYSSRNSWSSPLFAFRNSHFVLGICMVLSLLWSVACAPMTSFLFTDAEVIFNTTEEVVLPKGFRGLGFSEKSDMRAILEVVSATEIYDGARRGWVTSQHAFPPFMPVSEMDGENMTVSTLGYSGELDCRTIFSEPSVPLNNTKGGYEFPDFDDRGCKVSPEKYPVDSPYPFFAKTWATKNCHLVAGISRISLLAGMSQREGLVNVSLISCIPSYWVTPGNLTVTFSSSTEEGNITSVKDFDDTGSIAEPRPFESRTVFEVALHATTGFSPSDQVDGALFGQFVYALAAKKKPGCELEPETLLYALSVLFRSTFAVMASRVLFPDAVVAGMAVGTRSTSKTRLIVVLPVCATLMGVLTIMSVMTVVLFWYTRKPSILHEEPMGLQGYAKIMKDIDLERLIKISCQ